VKVWVSLGNCKSLKGTPVTIETMYFLPFFLVIAIVLLIISPASAEPGRLHGIIIGHGSGMLNNPFRILSLDDPLLLLDTYPLPADLIPQEKRKLDRVYYPRTRGELLEYDLMVFHGPRIQHFTPGQVHDLDFAFREGGMAAFCGLTGLGLGWEGPVLLGVIPIIERSVSPYERSYRPHFRENRDPVFTPLLQYGIDRVYGNVYTEMYPKPGATVWADIVPYGLPWLVSWRPAGSGPGMLWNVAHIFDIWWDENNNPYALDVATNMLFYSLEMDLVIDIPARRRARNMFRNVRVQMSLIVSMMNWAESFGANTAELSDILVDLEEEAERAANDYINQEYEPAISFLESLFEEVKLTTTKAVSLKNQALLWVYAIEWLTVSGTGAVCGFVLWTIMVRRSSYKGVETTRLKSIDEC